MNITKEEFEKRAEGLFGKDKEKWRFICPTCKRVQSVESVRNQMKNNISSQRYGVLKKGDSISVHSVCYGHDCNYVANGLFNSGILLIINPKEQHNENLKENCFYIFPLDGDKEMLEHGQGM